MRDLLVRAHLHRARAGSRTALAAAQGIAEQIEDPALHAHIRTLARLGYLPSPVPSACLS